MTYGICNLSAIALRKEARHSSEMVSQLLYNETYTVLDKTQEWVLVRKDNGPQGSGVSFYEGWIQAKQFYEISEEDYIAIKGKKLYLINKPLAEYKGKFLVVDCGMGFLEEEIGAGDVQYCDTTWLEKRKKDVIAFVVTHGHEDHIGALKYIWPKFKKPMSILGKSSKGLLLLFFKL